MILCYSYRAYFYILHFYILSYQCTQKNTQNTNYKIRFMTSITLVDVSAPECHL